MSHFKPQLEKDSRNTNPYIGCIVVQGQSKAEYIKEIKRGWEGFQIIFSTWEDTDKSLYEPTDIVIYNPYPEDRGIRNLGCQKTSTQSGFLLARELGWERALKWRSDQWPISGLALYYLFTEPGLNLYSWVRDSGGYICDYFMEGPIQTIIDLFEVSPQCQFPEKNLTQSFFEKGLNLTASCIVHRVVGDSNIYSGKWESWFDIYYETGVHTYIIPTEWNP
jgi:hypothetical protein